MNGPSCIGGDIMELLLKWGRLLFAKNCEVSAVFGHAGSLTVNSILLLSVFV